MDSYRPQRGRDNDPDEGFQIRGAARRQNHDPDPPPRRERDDRYYSRSDDYRRPRYEHGVRDAYYGANGDAYSDGYEIYDEPAEPPANTGDGDIANTDSTIPFLLIRGLRSNVNEEKLSKGLEKLFLSEDEQSTAQQPNLATAAPGSGLAAPPPPPLGAPSQPPVGAEPSSLKRVFLIRDRVTDKTMQYGFAEYHDLQNAKAALNKANKLGEKCTIASKQIAIDFPHAGVFCPSIVAGRANSHPRYQFEIRPGAFYTYYDTRYYASSLMINPDPPARSKSPSPPLAASKTANTKNTKKRTNEPDDGDALDKQSGTKSKKPKPGPTFDMWQKKQGELRGETVEADDDVQADAVAESQIEDDSIPDISYIVPGEKIGKGANIKVCLLCGTALSDTTSPEKHVYESNLHLQNLKEDDKISKAHERLKNFGTKFGISQDDFVKLQYGPEKSDTKPQPQYRDRAKERRLDDIKAGAPKKIHLSLKDRTAKSGPTPTAPPPSAENPAPAPAYGLGLKMLQKAGWTEGHGLGSGDGIAAPIEQNMYAAGVGLGHEGSKQGDAVQEAARLTRAGPDSFLEKTREGARARFQRLG